MTDPLVNDLVASWSEAVLGVPGRVLPVVRAPAGVLSSAGDTVDPVAPETVQGDPTGETRRDERPDRVRDDDLAAVGRRRDPRCAVDVQAHEARG